MPAQDNAISFVAAALTTLRFPIFSVSDGSVGKQFRRAWPLKERKPFAVAILQHTRVSTKFILLPSKQGLNIDEHYISILWISALPHTQRLVTCSATGMFVLSFRRNLKIKN